MGESSLVLNLFMMPRMGNLAKEFIILWFRRVYQKLVPLGMFLLTLLIMQKLRRSHRFCWLYLSNGDAVSRTKSDSSEISQDVSGNGNSERAGLSADCRTSSGSDITLSSSDGSSGLDTPRELGLRNTSMHPAKIGVPSVTSHVSEAQKPAVNALSSMYDVHDRSDHFQRHLIIYVHSELLM